MHSEPKDRPSLGQLARQLHAARAVIDVDADAIFTNPALDILFDLYAREAEEDASPPVYDAARTSRWIEVLKQRRLVTDADGAGIRLDASGRAMIDAYLRTITGDGPSPDA